MPSTDNHRKRFCSCTIASCNSATIGGRWVTYAQYYRHSQAELTVARATVMAHRIMSPVPDDLASSMANLQLVQTSDIPEDSGPGKQYQSVSLSNSHGQRIVADRSMQLYDMLADLNHELRHRFQVVKQPTNHTSLSCTDFVLTGDIDNQHAWFLRALDVVQAFNPEGYSDVHALKEVILRQLREYLTQTAGPAIPGPPESLTVIYNTEKYFSHPLLAMNPVVLGTIFVAVVLKLLGNLPRDSCSWVLQSISVILESHSFAGQPDIVLTGPEARLLKKIPRDIRTARKRLNLEAEIITYAACPDCSYLHPPHHNQKNKDFYPSFCENSYQQRCSQQLVKVLEGNGVIGRNPLKPFPYRQLADFIASLLARPGIEDAMFNSSNQVMSDGCMTDVWDGSVARELKGADGSPYAASKDGSLKLLWSLSIDWFNPFHNKMAGRKESTGVIALACLNLPPALRFKQENMYIAGIIPGPQEPSLDEINQYIRPLVEDFLDAWFHGIWFTRSDRYPQGRKCYCALIQLVCDLPASRKVAGSAGHQADAFCNLCLQKKSNINDIGCEKWKRLSRQEHVNLAVQWRDAKTKRDRDIIYRQNGIRWSELYRLPYWDPTRFVVIDLMHDIFLGLLQYHCRVVLHLSAKDASGIVRPDIASDAQIHLSTDIIRKIQDGIKETVRPSWQTKPPSKFGTPASGKLKADEWRTCMEFDIPVTLLRCWDANMRTASAEDSKRIQGLMDNTMSLVMAVFWCASRRTSKAHAERYTFHMQNYLRTLRELFPSRNLTPNQHAVVHDRSHLWIDPDPYLQVFLSKDPDLDP